MSPVDQARHKYILTIPGHVAAFRLSYELSTGSVILLVDSPWRMWLTDYLVPYEHFVPIADDLSDLVEKIRWCRSHDEECRQIAANAKQFYEHYLTRGKILDTLQAILIKTQQCTGHYLYNQTSPLDRQIREEEESLRMLYDPPRDTPRSTPGNVPRVQRMFGILQGVEWAINRSLRDGTFWHDAGVDKAVTIAQNKLSVVKKCTFAGLNIAIKCTNDQRKRREHIHEAYVGANGTNLIARQIPNVAYTFGFYEDTEGVHVVTEWIKGPTLAEYIRSLEFTFPDFLGIIKQICLALEVSQSICALVHYDLTPWNIIIERLSQPATIKYLIDGRKIVTVSTRAIPIIIDFGKSHIVYEGQHHGFVNMYHTSTIQDVTTLLIKSLEPILIDRKVGSLTPPNFKAMLRLANFLARPGPSGANKYCPDAFRTASDLKAWIRTHKSYSDMCSSTKGELEDLTPQDLFDYIDTEVMYPGGDAILCSFEEATWSLESHMTPAGGYKSAMDKGNSLQVYEYLYADSTDQQMQTYTNVFRRSLACDLPSPNNLLFVYYVAQSLLHNLKTVFAIAKRTEMLSSEGEGLYEQACDRLLSTYSPTLESLSPSTIECNVSVINRDVYGCPYTEDTFLNPCKLLSMIPCKNIDDLGNYRNLIDLMILDTGEYMIPTEVVAFYMRDLRELLTTPSILLLTKTADNNTIRTVSRNLCQTDIEWLFVKLANSAESPNDQELCTEAKAYMAVYKRIVGRSS